MASVSCSAAQRWARSTARTTAAKRPGSHARSRRCRRRARPRSCPARARSRRAGAFRQRLDPCGQRRKALRRADRVVLHLAGLVALRHEGELHIDHVIPALSRASASASRSTDAASTATRSPRRSAQRGDRAVRQQHVAAIRKVENVEGLRPAVRTAPGSRSSTSVAALTSTSPLSNALRESRGIRARRSPRSRPRPRRSPGRARSRRTRTRARD